MFIALSVLNCWFGSRYDIEPFKILLEQYPQISSANSDVCMYIWWHV